MHGVDFDRVAAIYQCLERLVFGRALDRARRAFLDALPQQGEVLLLGDGDGRYLEAAARARQQLRFVSLDASAAMLERASGRLAPDAPGRVEFVHSSVEEWLEANVLPVGERFDVVVTQFFLDCFRQQELEKLVSAIAALLRPGGHWVVAEFRQPVGSGWHGRICRSLLSVMYLFFRLAAGLRARQLPDHAGALRKAGLDLRGAERRLAWRGFITSEIWRPAG